MSGYNSCTLLPDGRVLLVPWSATSPLIYDPGRTRMTVSAAATPAELQTGIGLHRRRAAARRPRAARAQQCAEAADLRPRGGQPGGGRRWTWAGRAVAAACCSPDGRVLLPINFGLGQDGDLRPGDGHDQRHHARLRRRAGSRGGALLADGTRAAAAGDVLATCWSAASGIRRRTRTRRRPSWRRCRRLGWGRTWVGACSPDGRVVFTPWYSRHLVVWEPGLGAAYGRDVALAAFWNHHS